ncbi:MAG: V-type ATPase 116kDa subunit family protein [Spirochaetota bacterium]
MFSKADIRRVSIVIQKPDYRELIVMLGKSALMQIDADVPDEPVTAERTESGYAFDPVAAQSILTSATGFLDATGSNIAETADYDSIINDVASVFSQEQNSDLREAENIKKKPGQYKRIRAEIEKRLKSAESRLNEIRMLSSSGIDLYAMKNMKILSCIYGAVSSNDWLDYMDKNWFCYCKESRLLCVLPPEEKLKALDMLNQSGFAEISGLIKSERTTEEAEISAQSRIRDLKRKLEKIDLYYARQLAAWKDRMAFFKAVYSVILKIAGAESHLGFSDEIIIVNGWIDSRDADSLGRLLRNTCGNRFYFRIASRSETRKFRGRIPVLLKNSRLFRPFEVLVKLIGFPGNSEVDPTPAAAIAYVILFGVMFGDAGQGLVIAASGYGLTMYGRKKHGTRNNISDFGTIMIWCGFSAAIFGFLYGSIFSYERLLSPLLFHPMQNITKLFFMVIMIGVFIICSGLVLNIINGIIAGHYGESLFGTKGAAGFLVYASFIFFILRYVLAGIIPEAVEPAIVLTLPAFLFLMRGPLEYIFFHKEKIFPQGIFEYSVESVIEILEMFSGFIGNTISFIRAGAFALSHAGLSIAVFTLAGIADPSLKSAGALTVIVFGNIFIILLEGLVCAIQSMRLEFYEFFGKFFKGDGTGFEPFSLKFDR